MPKVASLTVALVAALSLPAPGLPGTEFEPAAGGGTVASALPGERSARAASWLSVPFVDPAGDQTGAAGDITTSNVTNDPMGLITFDVDVPNLPSLSPNDFFELLVDTDLNAATGDPEALGAEILIQLNGTATGGTYAFGRWNGTSYTAFDPASEQVSWGSGPLIVVSRTDLGVTNAFNFVEDTVVVSGTTVAGLDLAPDTGSYNYMLTGLAPPPPPPDTVPPNTRIVGGPAASTRRRTAGFRFASTEAGSRFQCKLDRRAWRACASPARFRNLAFGRHVFRVRAIDAAGNLDSTPAARSWRVRR
jgi:hypothetical protein